MEQVIGPYEVIREIGRGGMGVVYLARDLKLDRDVAIKALPEELAREADRLARFEREAKTLAQLNHQNIAGIFGIEEQDGEKYLILEYVEGETLADRLRRGAIPVTESIELAIKIASGIEAAHEAGVIHRDLKPDNIKITADNTVKVLDFGLARTTESSMTAVDADSPTVASPAEHSPTMPGVILGTAGYLSPEQARGRPVDARTDIFAFGCVLFEMLTGVCPFTGETATDCIGAAIHKEVDFARLPNNTPPRVRRLLSRCLAKDPRDRMQHIGDVRLELADYGIDADSITVVSPRARKRTSVERFVLGALIVVMAVAVVALLLKGPAPGDMSGIPIPTHWTITVPANSRLDLQGIGGKFDYSRLIAVAPDETAALTIRNANGAAAIYVKEPSAHAPRMIPGTEGGRGPFFSPDGKWVGFFADGLLKKAPLAGGSPQRICEIGESAAFDGSWSPVGRFIVFSNDRGMWRVSEDGGEVQRLTTPSAEDGELGHHAPRVTADGQHVLFTIAATPNSHVALLSIRDGKWRILQRDAAQGRWIGGDLLLFARHGELLVTGYNSESGTTTGPTTSLLQDIYTTPGLGGMVLTHFEVSSDGSLLYIPKTGSRTNDRLMWVEPGEDCEPKETVITQGAGTWVHPRLSPDGTRISVDIHTPDGMRDVYVHDIDRDQRSRLTYNGVTWESEWAPRKDSMPDRIAIMSAREAGLWGIYLAQPDRSTAPEQILAGEHLIPNSWSADGSTLFYNDHFRKGIWKVDLEAGTEPELVLQTERNERFPRLSPDGELLAYVADENGRPEVFVGHVDDLSQRTHVSSQGGSEPVWSRDGSKLYYRQADKMMGAAVTRVAQPAIDPAQLLFQGEYDNAPVGHQHYDVGPEIDQFLMIKHGEIIGPHEVRVELDWTKALMEN